MCLCHWESVIYWERRHNYWNEKDTTKPCGDELELEVCTDVYLFVYINKLLFSNSDEQASK